VDKGVILETREQGPSRRVVIDNDVMIIIHLQTPGIARVTNTAGEHTGFQNNTRVQGPCSRPMVFELQGSENRVLPLTWLVTLTTVQHYRTDCDSAFYDFAVFDPSPLTVCINCRFLQRAAMLTLQALY